MPILNSLFCCLQALYQLFVKFFIVLPTGGFKGGLGGHDPGSLTFDSQKRPCMKEKIWKGDLLLLSRRKKQEGMESTRLNKQLKISMIPKKNV